MDPVEEVKGAPIPPFTAAITELTEQYEREAWWLAATSTDDDYGRRIDIQVDGTKFTSELDVLPRDYKGFGVVVTRRFKATVEKN